MELESKQLKQLFTAFKSAFNDYSSLDRLVYYNLGMNLNEITSEGDLQTVIHELIKRGFSQGFLPGLIEAAHKEIPGNSLLHTFYEEVWIPSKTRLNAPSEIPSNIIVLPTNALVQTALHGESPSPETQNPSIPLAPLIDEEPKIDNPVQHVILSIDGIGLSHAYVNTARNIIQPIYERFLSNGKIFNDQCEHAVHKIREADGEVEKIPDALAQTPTADASLRYQLEGEQKTFSSEASKALLVLFAFSQQQIPLLQTLKDIQNKLASMLRSLQEIDRLINMFSSQNERIVDTSQSDDTTGERL